MALTLEKTGAPIKANSTAQALYRSASPTAVKRTPVLRPGAVRRTFTTPEELDMAVMHKAVQVALDIDRRMPAHRGPGSASGKWPLPTMPDEKPDDIEGERRAFMNRPRAPSAEEITFFDDVAALLAALAAVDLLGAKLVAGRAKRINWERLAQEDERRRGRTMLCYVWRAALHKMVCLDRALTKNVVDRVNKSA